jgi:DNA (cytosine-5)-methyltransferase 1
VTAFYNECDPYAAQWLRNLIAAGLIAPGIVDERKIQDIEAWELMEFTQCHFFAGIGVWSHALRNAGWPDDAPIWTGSCPCQPFSAAGKQKGFDDERHLWPTWFGLIEQCRPAMVIGEQVASALDWLDLVSADMEGAGYAFGASDLCAAGFGGAHIRQRLYFVGMANTDGSGQSRASGSSGAQEQRIAERSRTGRMADSSEQSSERHAGGVSRTQAEIGRQNWSINGDSPERHSNGGTNGGLADSSPEQHDRSRRTGARGWSEHPDGGGIGGLADPESAGRGVRHAENQWSPDAPINTLADAGDSAVNGQQRFAAERSHAPMLGRNLADWLFCRDGKWRPVEPSTFPLVDAAPARVGRLRAYGNALDAETATQFCEAVAEIAGIRSVAEYDL